MNLLARPSEWTRAGARPAWGTPFAGGPQHYFAFLSYSHRDHALGKWLHDELEKFRVPMHLVGRVTEHGAVPRRLTPIFRDLGELPASDDLGEEIRHAVAASRFLIVLCSPAAATSRWTNAEIETFKRARPEGCILAAIVAGEPFASDIPGREQEECLPRALRLKYDRRGRPTAKRAEPLCADLREVGEARRMGFLKLVAGMLGVGLDDLVQRDTVRRHQKMAIVSAASIAGMLVASALAVTAIPGRDEARDQRREAESLIGFMLGDLRDKLEPIGKLDALDGVGSRVLAYYQKQDMADLPDAALLQRARALGLMGEVANLRGDTEGALRLYRAALAGTAEAMRRIPDDPKRLFDHAQNVFWIGEIARDRGQSGQAEAAFREYKRLADQMVAIEPSNLKWRMEVLYANENLGIVLYEQRRFAEAARQFASGLRPMEGMASLDPGNSEYQLELSNLLAWFADAERAQGRFDSAIAARQRQISFLGRLIAGGAANVQFRQHLIPAHQGLGRLLAARGEQGAAIKHLRMAVAMSDALIPTEPENTHWVDLGADARLALAEHLLAFRDVPGAASEARVGCSMVERLLAIDSTIAVRRSGREHCLRVRAKLALATGSPGEALDLARRSLAIALSDPERASARSRHRIAGSYSLLGDVHAKLGDGKAALAAWQAGLQTLPSGVAELPSEMSQRAALLRKVGRMDEARPLEARLKAFGYRHVA